MHTTAQLRERQRSKRAKRRAQQALASGLKTDRFSILNHSTSLLVHNSACLKHSNFLKHKTKTETNGCSHETLHHFGLHLMSYSPIFDFNVEFTFRPERCHLGLPWQVEAGEAWRHLAKPPALFRPTEFACFPCASTRLEQNVAEPELVQEPVLFQDSCLLFRDIGHVHSESLTAQRGRSRGEAKQRTELSG